MRTLDWVCGQSWKAYVSHTVFFGSMAIGVVFFGAISDKVGRVPVMVAVYMLAGVGAATSYFCKDIYVFLATRVIEGGVMLSICTIPFVLALEYMPAKKRMLMAGVFGFAYPLLGATIPWVAYALAHWRLLNAVILLPCLGGTVVTLFIPESIRWLLSKGKTDKAKKVLLCVARINGKHLKVSAIDSLQPPRQGDSVPSSTAAIFKYPSLRRSFVITLFLRMIACLANQAGQLYVATASDDPFVLSSTTNAVDIVGIWVAVPLADKCGRRATVACSCALAGLCYLIAAGLNGMPAALLAALMAGRTMLTIAYDVGSVYAAEIYPTEIRTQALSTRQAIGSVGRILSSHVVQLAVYSRSLPLFVVGGLSCVSALITLPLPETNNQRLPETFQEAEAMHELPVVPLFPCCVRAKVRRGDVLAMSAAATIQADAPHDTERKEHLLSHPAAEHGGVGHAMSGISKL
ncbi:hypothetical protein HPB49_002479 [Dermacentor silvarum]|uniref:Uncharacterized protein n=1 Tax=Dermacentor silvarum TaxID=543639 RepID=A0ACB8CJ26_DERSI|nr:hypothetical protein HPB49_002479 [Dermacentor silvarum]